MAKERNLPSKSTLTTSDYIRVVGSDNASYKQGISSVMTTMGIGKAVSYGDLASFYADFSAMAVDTKYFVSMWGNCSTALGLPSATYKGYVTKASATLCDMTVQTYGASGVNVEYIGRITFDNNGAVTATNWTKQPTRTEVDALNSKTTFEMRSVSFSYSLASGANTNTNLKTLIDNDLPSGKRFITLGGYSTNSVDVVMLSVRYADTAYSLQIQNLGSITRTATVVVYYLCAA